jgi:hypothetical protein
MFNNKRFITHGIESDVPLWLQNLMWYAIETMEVEPKDYLQVFTLSAENGKQKIAHAQEQPPYEKQYTVDVDAPIDAKIFVIDDQTHSTMLLAEEY